MNEKTFLRGAQVTDKRGQVEFMTLYPGWYRGRTPHVHVKVYLHDNTLLTTQMYFPEEVSDHVYQEDVYNTRDDRRLRNGQDGIFRRSGADLVLNVARAEEGYVGVMTMGVRKQ